LLPKHHQGKSTSENSYSAAHKPCFPNQKWVVLTVSCVFWRDNRWSNNATSQRKAETPPGISHHLCVTSIFQYAYMFPKAAPEHIKQEAAHAPEHVLS
jgi:hypothetical protein